MAQSNTVGVFETKTNLNKIINRVIEGEEFIITKRGVEVAKITPLNNKNDLSEIFKEIQNLKELLPSSFININEIIEFKEEGRK